MSEHALYEDAQLFYGRILETYKVISGNQKELYTIVGGEHNYLQDFQIFKDGMNEVLN